MKSITLSLLCLLLLSTSCQKNTSSMNEIDVSSYSLEVEDEEMEIRAPRSAEPPSPFTSTIAIEDNTQKKNEKFIKTGYMQVEVNDLGKGKADMDLLVKSFNAHYSNEEFQHNNYQSNYSLNIRIPVHQFELFIQELESGNGKILSKNITSRNVTEQFIDLEIRQKNKEAYLKQYHQLLKKAANIEDLLEIQERIRRLSEEIEATKGRLRYLSDQVGYSTLHLTIIQHHDQVLARTPFNIGERLRNAARGGLEGAVSFIIGVVSMWPFIIGLLALLLFRGKILSFFKR